MKLLLQLKLMSSADNIKNRKYTMESQNADSIVAAGQAKQIWLNNPQCHTDAGPEISSRAKKRE
jgi:hypothetical protein